MNRSTISSLVGFGVTALVVTMPCAANEIDLTKPADFANPPGEMPALTNANEGSLGAGSWQADDSIGNKQHLIYLQGGAPGPYAGGPTSYPAPGVNPNLLFPESEIVTLNDLVSLSWDTKTDAQNDWFVDIFTKDDEDDQTSYYGYNFDAVAVNAVNASASGGFKRHSFGESGGKVYMDEDLSDGGSLTLFDLEDVQDEYGDEKLKWIALGTATNYEDFSGLVDNFQFTYTNADDEEISRQIDLEASDATAQVPLPPSLPLMIGGLGVFGLCQRKLGGRT